MMSSEKCRCPHHMVMKVLAVLAWVSGILFFWSSLISRAVGGYGAVILGYDAGYWAWVVVILVLLSFTARGCKCCCGEKHCGTCPVDKKPMM